jgi:hypothetical protein
VETECFYVVRAEVLKARDEVKSYPCGGGVEYLHRDPASRRRRRKEKSEIWDSKIWSRVPWYSDPRKTALAKASSICKTQTRPLVRESVPQKQERNSQTIINTWSWAPDGTRHEDLLTDSPSVPMWLWLELILSSVLVSVKRGLEPGAED